MKKNAPSFGLNIGTSLFLAVLVILSLLSFAVLSLASAKADEKLSSQAATHTTEYYNADTTAKKQLEDIMNTADTLFSQNKLTDTYLGESVVKQEIDSTLSFTEQDGNILCSMLQPINDHQSLDIQVEIVPPKSGSKTQYNILRWKVSNIERYGYTNGIN